VKCGRQFGGAPGEGLAVLDRQQVGAEPGDLGEQPGRRRRRQAEHGDDGGDTGSSRADTVAKTAQSQLQTLPGSRIVLNEQHRRHRPPVSRRP